MDAQDDDVQAHPPLVERPRVSPPQGYRQGLITAVTVLLGFSLSFLRFWGFEASGEWTFRSVVAAGAIVIAAVMQILSLYRSLRIADDDVIEFAKTARLLLASSAMLLAGLALALLIEAGVIGGTHFAPPHR